MSRKAFCSDLDSVFAPGAQYEPNIDASPWLLETAAAASPEPAPATTARPSAAKTKRRPRKSFGADLDSVFADAPAAEQSPREEPPARPDLSVRQRELPRRSIARLSGIDALIRDTTDGRAIAAEDARLAEARKPGVAKRVTFTYDRDQFARLKQIAREEGAYLKDIIAGLLNDYLDGHRSDN